MSQQELLKRVVEVLTTAGIDYMVTGSLASSIQGEPRSTHDIDLVVDIKANHVPALMQAFSSRDFYLDEHAIGDAIRSKTMFNLLSLADGEKVDFWILTDEPFDQSRFSRKTTEDVLGMQLNVSAPEDTILVKLRWAELSGGSEKQFTDALRVYELQKEKLDMTYLNHWANQLKLLSSWQRIQQEAEGV